MAKTLLDIVQGILSDMDGDLVNSIGDTEESEQVARIVVQAYNAMMSNTTWPHTRRAVAVTPRSDGTVPTHMVLNDNVKALISVRYDCRMVGETRKVYREMVYQDPDLFLRQINNRNNDADNIDVIIDDSGIELLIRNDVRPHYYTSFNDTDIIFDSYDNLVDSTLQEAKFQAQGYIIPDFALEDGAIPDLPVDAEILLIEESTSKAQFKLRQFQDVKSEQEAGRQKRWLARNAWRVGGGLVYPNYGRRRAKNGYSKDVNHEHNGRG